MKQVSGFQSEDGTFFETEDECEEYESEQVLDKLCESHGIRPYKYKEAAVAMFTETMRFVNAYKASETTRKIRKVDEEVSRNTRDYVEQRDAVIVDPSIDPGAEKVTAAIQQFEASRGQSMRPLGRRERKKNVSDTGEGDGS